MSLDVPSACPILLRQWQIWQIWHPSGWVAWRNIQERQQKIVWELKAHSLVDVGRIRLPGFGFLIFLAFWDLSGGTRMFWSLIWIPKKIRILFQIQFLFGIWIPYFCSINSKFTNFVYVPCTFTLVLKDIIFLRNWFFIEIQIHKRVQILTEIWIFKRSGSHFWGSGSWAANRVGSPGCRFSRFGPPLPSTMSRIQSRTYVARFLFWKFSKAKSAPLSRWTRNDT